MSSLWAKAKEAASDARFLYKARRFDAACNRAYYAMFNAARALLDSRGLDPTKAKRHATVLRLFSIHFVKDGPFDAVDGQSLGDAGRARNQADYSSVEIGPLAAQEIMASLDRSMGTAEPLLDEYPKREQEDV